MGKERWTESAKRGLNLTSEFVKTKPKTAALGLLALGGASSGSALGLSIVNGNVRYIIINSVLLGIDAAVTAYWFKIKNSKINDNQSNVRNNSQL